MRNILAIHEFVSYWKGLVRIEPIGKAFFHAVVTYKYQGKEVKDKTLVNIQRTGYEDGKISIEETPILCLDEFHLDFTPDYQSYGVTEEKLLKVEGSSKKMGGDYEVLFMPFGAAEEEQ